MDQDGDAVGAARGGRAAGGRIGEEELLARLIEEIDDTNAILDRVRRRGVPEELARGLAPRPGPAGYCPPPNGA